MGIFEVLEIACTPAGIGCLAGIGVAWLLQLAFPSQDLIFFQALIVVAGTLIGLYCS